jgi:hypothetical protein
VSRKTAMRSPQPPPRSWAMKATSLSFMRRRRRRLRSQIEWWLHLISTVLGKAVAFGAHEVGF